MLFKPQTLNAGSAFQCFGDSGSGVYGLGGLVLGSRILNPKP